jgi:xanthine dehydrogenase YagS FAD-binding subunit
MNNFEFAQPRTEEEAIALLTERGRTVVLAAGMDLVPLLRKSIVSFERVVDIGRVPSLKGIHVDDEGVTIGALTTLEEIVQDPYLAEYPSLKDVVDGIRAVQVQQTGTLGGDLCHLPNCWYFRSGYGLFGMDGRTSLPEVGDNRYHAILGNLGPAKYVSASRFAPALIALGAQVRLIGPEPAAEEWLPLSQFHVIPKNEQQGVTRLRPGQLLSHVRLPAPRNLLSATYEVLELEGLDWPLAAAACALDMDGGFVREAKIVLGHVAPTPWISDAAAQALYNQPITPETADLAGEIAVRDATPLAYNGYKVQLAKTSVARALLKATGQLEGGL